MTNPARQTIWRKTARPAFTLIELLVVVAILMLLIAIVAPSFQMAREHAWSAMCQGNLHRLPQVLHTGNAADPSSLPSSNAWLWTVYQRQASSLLRCPKGWFDDGLHYTPQADRAVPPTLDGIYIRHEKGAVVELVYVTDVINSARGQVNWSQNDVYYNYTGSTRIGYNQVTKMGWFPPHPTGSNQHVFSIDDDACTRITVGATEVVIESVCPDNQGWTTLSDHWVGLGSGGSNWQSEVLMTLTGGAHGNIVDPPVAVKLAEILPGSASGGIASYGMNNQVPGRFRKTQQMLLVEYGQSIVDVDRVGVLPDDNFDAMFRPRHFNRGNYVTIDGSVRSAYQWEIDPGQPPTSPNPLWLP